MAAYVSVSGACEVHHEVPRCLLELRDQADAHDEFDGEGIQLWVEYELEALRWGVDPDILREELEELLSNSTVEVSRAEHRNGRGRLRLVSLSFLLA